MSLVSRCPVLPHFRRPALQRTLLFQLYREYTVTQCVKCLSLRQISPQSRTGFRHSHHLVKSEMQVSKHRRPDRQIYKEKHKLLTALEHRKTQLQRVREEQTAVYQPVVKKKSEWNLDESSVNSEPGVNFSEQELVSIHHEMDSIIQSSQNIDYQAEEYLSNVPKPQDESQFTSENDSTLQEESKQVVKGKTKKSAKQKKSTKAKTEEEKSLTKEDLPDKEVRKKSVKKTGKDAKVSEAMEGLQDGDLSAVQDKLSTHYQYMLALLDVCANNNMIEYANSYINVNGNADHFKLKPDVELYNLQLQGWAKKGEITLVKLIFEKMNENGVKPNYQSYAGALECLGRRKKMDRTTIKKLLTQMKKEKLEVEKIFHHCALSASQREHVLKAIFAVQTDFKAEMPLVRNVCDNELVDDIYLRAPPNSEMGNEIGASTFVELFDSKQLRRMVRKQIDVELNGGIKLQSIEAVSNPDKETQRKREILQKHKDIWKASLMTAFKNLKKQSKGFKAKWQLYPFLSVLEPSDYVNIMLDFIPQVSASTEGEALMSASNELGRQIFKKYALHYKIRSGVADKINSLYMDYAQFILDDVLMTKYQFREYWQKLNLDTLRGPTLDLEAVPWNKISVSIGLSLAELLMKEIKIDVNMLAGKKESKLIPGFYHMYAYRNVKQVGFLKPHPILVDLIKDAKEPELWFDSEVLPMLSPPLPWSSNKHGGYLLASTKIMRSRDDMIIHDIVLEQTEQSNLFPVFDSLNQLGAVPWKINQRMLDLISDVFLDRGSVHLDIPQPITECPELPKITENVDPTEMTALRKERMALRRQKAEMHSLRMDFLYKLSIANKYRHDIFWFPHNMDFRGRVYPCPPHFNHLGSDPMRSILLFAKGRPLGEQGLNWLKIHLVNLTGLKKRNSLQERIEFADSIMDDILDSADNPTTGRKWWQGTDEPWQALACCMEIANATRSPDPTKYICHFPVHQDGSCNGLQHYAALGRDVIGAQQVNLHPFDAPQDVYAGVAQKVEEARKMDAENGIKIAQVLDGFVERKVVKQTVMTVVYGVTRFGGHRQILKQLKDLPNFPEEYQWEAAGYLVTKVFQSLREMFTKTREIQDWFTESCKAICKAGRPMEWMTPLGLPIIQSYQKRKGGGVRLKDRQARPQSVETFDKPDTKKQTNAFAPNFIHSIDSTHMMLTSLFCQKAGITFVSVHDCYWTHPSTVDIMNRICRQQFVALHKTPILEQLSEFMVEKYSDLDGLYRETSEAGSLIKLLKRVPDRGDFDLNNVLQSTYFFS